MATGDNERLQRLEEELRETNRKLSRLQNEEDRRQERARVDQYIEGQKREERERFAQYEPNRFEKANEDFKKDGGQYDEFRRRR